MVSLNYSSVDGIVCGDVAVAVVKELQPHAVEARTPSPKRFHMAFSLGGAVLILATLLCRDLSAINLQDRRPSFIESYQLAMAILRNIACHLIAARRILADLEDIVQVVDLLLDDALVQNLDFASVVPPNVESLFPYTALGDFDPFAGTDDWGGDQVADPVVNDELGLWGSFNNEILWS